MSLEPLAALCKLLLYAGVLIGGGAALSWASLRCRLGEAERLAPRLIAAGAATTLLAALGSVALLLRQLGGLDAATAAAVLGTPTGLAFGLQIAGGALLLAASRHGALLPLRLVAGAALFASFGVNGHAAAASASSGLLAGIHVLAAGWWLSSLLLLRGACRSLPAADLAGLTRHFGRLALAGIVAMAASGAALVLVLVPFARDAWLMPYGQNLALKIAFAASALAMATYARTRIVPRLETGATASRSLRRTVIAEIALIVGALAATAWLTTFRSPHEYHEVLAAAQAGKDLESRRQALAMLLDQHWEYSLSTHPEDASVLGDRRWNDRWSEVSIAAVERDLARKREFLDRLEGIDTAGFPDQESLDQTLLMRELRREVEDAQFEEWLMPVDPRRGFHLRAARLAAELPFAEVADYEDYATRLRHIAAPMEGTLALMLEGQGKNLMPPRFLLEKVAQQAATLAALEAEISPFALPLAKMPQHWSAAEQDRLRALVLAAIREGVQPAYARFAAFVETEHAPAGRAEEGLWSLPDGEARYAAHVRAETTTDLTAEEIHQLGLAEIERIESRLLAIAKQLGFADLESLNASISRNPALEVKSGEHLVALYREHMLAMQMRLPMLLFWRLPKAGLEVVPMEAYRASEAASADYVRGSADGARPGRIQVNTSQATRRQTIRAETLAYHEGVPGRHLQLSIQQELPSLPPFRKHVRINAYGEGWALYAEALPREVGLLQDPYSRYGQLQDELLHAIALVVDTGIHAKRWTRQQALQFVRDHSAVDEVELQSEIDRSIAQPGQALASKIGQLKILELRRRAVEGMASRFDARRFHDEILGAGPLPLDLLEQRIEAFIAAPAAEDETPSPYGAHVH